MDYVLLLKEPQEDTAVVNQFIVEKIMGVREGTRELHPEEEQMEEDTTETKTDESNKENLSSKESDKEKKEPQKIKVTEYFVKFKNL